MLSKDLSQPGSDEIEIYFRVYLQYVQYVFIIKAGIRTCFNVFIFF